MTLHTHAAITRYARRAVTGIAILTMAACGGGGTSSEQTPAALAITTIDSNVPIQPGASLFGLSKIAIAKSAADASDIGASDITVSFNDPQGTPQPLVRDLADPSTFWMPVVSARTAGSLTISVPDRANLSMAVTLGPFQAPGAPGLATRNFLEASLLNINAALKDLAAGRPLPDLLHALTSTADLTQQELTWVTATMKNGTAVMATRKDGTPVKMTTDDLKALDQMVLHTEALRTQTGTLPAAARLSPWMKIMDILIPSAFAQTSDSAEFIRATKATGDALGLTAYMVPGIAPAGPSAFRRSADAQAISLNMAGLYAAHYGNALATIQTLPNLTFPEPVDAVQIAVSALFAGVINEITLLDLDYLAQADAVTLVTQFIANVDTAAEENIVMDKVSIFKTRSVGIHLCPAGESPVADPNGDFVSCVGLVSP
jgi:hypothetical protein